MCETEEVMPATKSTRNRALTNLHPSRKWVWSQREKGELRVGMSG